MLLGETKNHFFHAKHTLDVKVLRILVANTLKKEEKNFKGKAYTVIVLQSLLVLSKTDKFC